MRRILDPESGDNVMFSELTTVSDYEYDAPNYHEYYNVATDPYVSPSIPQLLIDARNARNKE